MDPVTIIVSAVALGASIGLKDSAADAVKDAYSGLKRLIAERYRVDVAAVERRPDSVPKRDSLEEDLADAGAGTDDELLEAARRVLVQVKDHDPDGASPLGIDLERVEAAALRIRNVEADGTSVQVRDSRFTGDIDIEGVRSGKDRPGRP